VTEVASPRGATILSGCSTGSDPLGGPAATRPGEKPFLVACRSKDGGTALDLSEASVVSGG